MEENFLLLYYGKFAYKDLCYMTREERWWMLRRINEEIEKKNKAEKSAMSGSGNRPSVPSMPKPRKPPRKR
jgi:hypothetical protein